MPDAHGGAALVARTRRLDLDVDLPVLAGADGVLFERAGEGFAGLGVATQVPAELAATALAAIDVDDEVGLPGCGAVAFGALPFRDDGPEAERHRLLTIPSLVVGRSGDGTRWVTTISPPAGAADAGAATAQVAHALAAARSGSVPPGPSAFEVRATLDPAEWCDRVADAVGRINAGKLDKVVLARELRIEADAPIPVDQVLARLRNTYPDCYLFSVDGFVGATPELLVARRGDIVRADPHAGTTPRRGDPDADARAAAGLFASATYRHEHQVAVEEVHQTLLDFSSYVDHEAEPRVVTLANVHHLATKVEGRLSHPPASALELRDALHPTPAVCGRPTDTARDLIAELEGFDRGRYAGSVGWVDAAGNGVWAVSIRCAQLDGPNATVWGGNGMVGGSDPATELVETRAKLQVMLNALIRP
ncbi:MAG TPA: isochorismate synthase [Acidimicrobiales bacterium]|nr:isochorismate synthase [Acidimicrobiales bacterium]